MLDENNKAAVRLKSKIDSRIKKCDEFTTDSNAIFTSNYLGLYEEKSELKICILETSKTSKSFIQNRGKILGLSGKFIIIRLLTFNCNL